MTTTAATAEARDPAPCGTFYVLRGQVSQMGGAGQDENPFDAGSAEAILWLYGWRKRLPVVSHETPLKRGKTKRPRKTARTRKPPYSDAEREVLRLCWDHMTRQEIADILDRPRKSIINEGWRLGLRRV